jgi:multidrug efflux system membrane fusion protein
MYSADPPPPPSTPAAPAPVVGAKVEVADFPVVMMGIGSVAAYNVVDVRAQVTGTIVKIGFVEGQPCIRVT